MKEVLVILKRIINKRVIGRYEQRQRDRETDREGEGKGGGYGRGRGLID